MTRKDQRFLSFSALAAVVLLILPLVGTGNSADEGSTALPAESLAAECPAAPTDHLQQKELPVQDTPIIRYIIMEENGRVMVYDVCSREVIDSFPVDLTILPEADRKCLQRGIPVYSDAQLNALLCGFSE